MSATPVVTVGVDFSIERVLLAAARSVEIESGVVGLGLLLNRVRCRWAWAPPEVVVLVR